MVQFLVADVAAQGCAQISAFQVVGRQRVARQQGLTVALRDHTGHDLPGGDVEAAGRAEHPHHVAAVFLFVFQKVHEPVVVVGEAGLAVAAAAEGEHVLGALFFVARKAVRVHVDAFGGVFGAPCDHQIAFADVAELDDLHLAVPPDCHRVHAGVLRQMPLPADLEILRVDGRGVEILRRCLGAGRLFQPAVGRVRKRFLRKIRFEIGVEFKHDVGPLPGAALSSVSMSLFRCPPSGSCRPTHPHAIAAFTSDGSQLGSRIVHSAWHEPLWPPPLGGIIYKLVCIVAQEKQEWNTE